MVVEVIHNEFSYDSNLSLELQLFRNLSGERRGFLCSRNIFPCFYLIKFQSLTNTLFSLLIVGLIYYEGFGLKLLYKQKWVIHSTLQNKFNLYIFFSGDDVLEVIILDNAEELSQEKDDCEEEKEATVEVESEIKEDTHEAIQEEAEKKETDEEGSRNGSTKKKKRSQEKREHGEGRHSRHGSKRDAKNSSSEGVEALLQALTKAGHRGEKMNEDGKPMSRHGSRKDSKTGGEGTEGHHKHRRHRRRENKEGEETPSRKADEVSSQRTISREDSKKEEND